MLAMRKASVQGKRDLYRINTSDNSIWRQYLQRSGKRMKLVNQIANQQIADCHVFEGLARAYFGNLVKSCIELRFPLSCRIIGNYKTLALQAKL